MRLPSQSGEVDEAHPDRTTARISPVGVEHAVVVPQDASQLPPSTM
jgi:hypothetical protein